MKKREVIEGRRFSQRKITVVSTEDGESALEEINWDNHFSKSLIRQHKEKAIAILEANGIKAREILSGNPGGSILRYYVLNELNCEPDSSTGIACRICELCIRLEVIPKLGNTYHLLGDAYRLGRLVMLDTAYAVDSGQHKKAAKAPRPSRRNPLREKIVAAMRVHRREGRQRKEALQSMTINKTNGLSLRYLPDEDKYLAIDEDGAQGTEEKKYGDAALELMWSEAGRKPDPKSRG